MEKDKGKEAIKVVYVITRLIRGGAQQMLVSTLNSLDKKRYVVSVASGSEVGTEGEFLAEVRQMGIQLILLPHLVRKISPLHDLLGLLRLTQLMRKGKYDIVHTYTSKAGILGRLAARLARVPIIVHSPHGHIFSPGSGIANVPRNRLFLRGLLGLERLAGLFTDKITTLTELSKKEQVELGIANADKFVTIYNGIELDRYRKVNVDVTGKKKEIGLPLTSPLIGTIARLAPVKGHRYLIKALGDVTRAIPDLRVLLVGDGQLCSELQDMVRKLNLSRNVLFTGLRRDVPEILAILDIFVLPSLYEGFSVALMEAMAAGKPVIATRVGGIPEIVVDGETGILIPPRDPDRLAQVIIKLLQDREKAKKLGDEGRRRAISLFSLERMMERMNRLYEELIEQKLGLR